MEELEFEYINGKQINSVLLYTTAEKQLYKLKSKTPRKHYYVCYKTNCGARVNLIKGGNVCVKSLNRRAAVHNHGSNEAYYNCLKALGDLKKECLSNSHGLRSSSTAGCVRDAFNHVVEE